MTDTALLHPLLSQHPALQALSGELRQLLLQSVTLQRYAPGQALSCARQIPAQVLLILEGSARLLALEHGGWITLERLHAGSWVGLASLLRVGPCEEVAAAEPLLAAAIPDALALRLLADQGFAAVACSQPFTAELAALLQHLQSHQPSGLTPLRQLLQRVGQEVQLVQGDLMTLRPELRLYAASCNLLHHPYGARLDPQAGLPASEPPLPPRLLALPDGLLTPPAAPIAAHAPEAPDAPDIAAVPQAGVPLASGLDLGQDRYGGRPRFSLIRAEGSVDETLACFQMLAAELELPFRRDSIEKTLRDVLRRGQTPDLQLCGSLAAILGLKVSGATVPAVLGTRLHTPALVSWESGFALLRASNAAGMQLASPRAGLVQLQPDALDAAFPEGIQLLLLERSAQTPEQRFGPAWFWPALRRHRSVLLQVLVASFVLQLFGLAGPLLIQVIID